MAGSDAAGSAGGPHGAAPDRSSEIGANHVRRVRREGVVLQWESIPPGKSGRSSR